MSRESALVKNTIIIAIGKICTQFVSFFLLPFYTNVLSTEEFGAVDLLNTLVGLLLPIVTFQVEQAVFRDLIEIRHQEKEKREVVSSAFFSVCLQCLVFFIIVLLAAPLIQNRYLHFLAANVIASIFSSLFLQIARGLGNNVSYAFGSFVSAASTIGFNVLFLAVWEMGAAGMLLGTLLGNIVCAAYLFFSLHLYKYISLHSFMSRIIKKLWEYSLPLVPNAISWWVFNASDRVIVSAALGLSQNGVLSAASKFSSAYIGIYNVFNISWTESVTLHLKDQDGEEFFNRMFQKALGMFFGMAAGLIAVLPFAFPIMVNEAYDAGYGLAPILILASLCNCLIGLISAIYIANRNTKAVAHTSIIAAFVNIAAHLGLIQFVGLYAAAVSTLASFGVMSLYRLYDIQKRYFKIQIPRPFLLKTFAAFSVILAGYYLDTIYLKEAAFLLAVLYAWDLNKDFFFLFWGKVKDKIVRR